MTANNMKTTVACRVDGVNEELIGANASFRVSPISVSKPNLGELLGFATNAIPEDGLLHPVIYWDEAFANLTDKDLAGHITHIYNEGMSEAPGLPEALQREYILEHVLPKVFERDRNAALLEEHDMPYRLLPDTDLFAVYYVPLPDVEGTVQITHQVADALGLTEDELFEKAKDNVLRHMTIRSMNSVMCDMMGVPEPDTDDDVLDIYVVSNPQCQYGAGALAGGEEAFRRMAAAVGTKKVFILPSSVHEVLAVADDGSVTFEVLLDMVTEINAAVVAPQDILSDNVYHFDTITGKLVHCR